MYLLATSELRHGRSGGEGSRELLEARELEHDAQVYRAYLEAADRLTERGDRLRRVVLDYELKREYQRFLRERNRAAPTATDALIGLREDRPLGGREQG